MVQHWNSATSKSETVNSATLNSAISKAQYHIGKH